MSNDNPLRRPARMLQKATGAQYTKCLEYVRKKGSTYGEVKDHVQQILNGDIPTPDMLLAHRSTEEASDYEDTK